MTTATQGNVKKVPFNIAAERSVLAGLCQSAAEVYVEVNEILTEECFTTEDNKLLYRVISDILSSSAKVDIPTIIARATSDGHLTFVQDKVKQDYIRSLFSYNVTPENVKKTAAVIRKLAIARGGQKVARDMYNALSEINGGESFDAIISRIEQPVFDYTTSLSCDVNDKTIKIGDEAEDYVNYVASERPDVIGISSPWPVYNEAIGGGRRRGGVFLFGARPKTGKSSYAINDAIHVAKLNIPVLYLDTEMSKEGQMPRILASLSGLEINEIERGKFALKGDYGVNMVMSAAKELKQIPFFYRRVAGKPFDEILSIIRRFVVQDVGTDNGRTKDCIIIYDYFKLMDMGALDKLQEHQAIGFQIQELCDFAGKYDVPVSAYVQLNRDGIDKDTSAVISQSDRLVWNCSSVALIKRKTQEEIMAAGPEHGNMKMVVMPEQRFGPGMDDGDWINFSFDKSKCIIKELGTKNNNVVQVSGSFNSVQGTINTNTISDGEDEYDEDVPFETFG